MVVSQKVPQKRKIEDEPLPDMLARIVGSMGQMRSQLENVFNVQLKMKEQLVTLNTNIDGIAQQGRMDRDTIYQLKEGVQAISKELEERYLDEKFVVPDDEEEEGEEEGTKKKKKNGKDLKWWMQCYDNEAKVSKDPLSMSTSKEAELEKADRELELKEGKKKKKQPAKKKKKGESEDAPKKKRLKKNKSKEEEEEVIDLDPLKDELDDLESVLEDIEKDKKKEASPSPPPQFTGDEIIED